MSALIDEIIRNPVPSLLVVVNLFLIESLLSVDNAAVLATTVMGLSRRDRVRALRYGLAGAYFFRGICLLLASTLIKVWWLKGVGGLYLIYLAAKWAFKKNDSAADEIKEANRIYGWIVARTGKFWATVITVELMDLAFSMDNVFAAVAYSRNIIIILAGVFMGILTMRFVAQGFVKLMERFPFLEGCAYVIIALLGIKLSLSFYGHVNPRASIVKALETRIADWVTSFATIAIFLLPLCSSMLFNFPARHKIRS